MPIIVRCWVPEATGEDAPAPERVFPTAVVVFGDGPGASSSEDEIQASDWEEAARSPRGLVSPTSLVEGTDTADEEEDEAGWVRSPTGDYQPHSPAWAPLDSPGWRHEDLIFEAVSASFQ